MPAKKKNEQVNDMILDLGPGSLDLLDDGSWVWGDGLGNQTGSGNSPVDAIASAWAALPED